MGGSTPVLTPGKTPIGTPAMNMATPTPGRNFRCCFVIQRIENQRLLDIVSDVISVYRVRARVCTLS